MRFDTLLRVLIFQPGLLEFIAFLPANQATFGSGLPAQGEAEAGHGGVANKVHAGTVLVARLVIPVFRVIFGLLESPGKVVAFVFHALRDRKRRDTDTGEAEVI